MNEFGTEIVKPGGFLLVIMKKLAEVNSPIKIETLENKIKEFEKLGVITYGFERGFDNEMVSGELYDDLRVFEDVKWIEVDFDSQTCKLTDKGLKVVNEFKVPDLVIDKFNSLFEKKV